MDVLTDLLTNSDIDVFMGDYFFLSNFFLAKVEFDWLVYPSTEHAYQAYKSTDPVVRYKFTTIPTAGKAKRYGREIAMRLDWEEIKDNVMYNIVFAKFSQHKDLAALLDATGDRKLIEGNTWGDVYWGTVNGIGKNRLGEILMRVRYNLRNP